MSWRDRFTPGGDFRGAKFWVETDDLDFGRRKIVHEFPLQDKPVVQDQGKKTREFSTRIFVLGDDYDFDRNALINAIEKPGPGTLTHPYLGAMNVEITSARKTESTREGGKATFSLTYIEVDDFEFNFEIPDTPAVVKKAVEKTLADSIVEFGENFNVLSQIQDYVEDIQKTLEKTLDAVETVTDGVTQTITSLIRSPAEMAVAIVGSISNLQRSLQTPAQALEIYKTLFNTDSNAAVAHIPLTTSNRLQQKQNTDFLLSLIKRAAIAEACFSISVINWETLNEAISIRDEVLSAIDLEMQSLMNDKTFNAIEGLRAALVEDIRVRGAQMPRIKYFQPEAELPALVLAHRLHNDVRRDAEIIARNSVRHPGFITACKALEILTDA